MKHYFLQTELGDIDSLHDITTRVLINIKSGNYETYTGQEITHIAQECAIS